MCGSTHHPRISGLSCTPAQPPSTTSSYVSSAIFCPIGVVSPQVCQSPSASWLEDPLSLPPTSDSRNPPRPVALAHRLSISTSGSSPTCSAAIGWPPRDVIPSSTMAPPSVGSTVGRLHGGGQSPAWLLLLLLPPSSPPWTLFVTLFVVLLTVVRPSPEPPLDLSACLPASPLPSPVTIPLPLLFPPPKSPSIPPAVSAAQGHAFQEGGDMSHYKLLISFLSSCSLTLFSLVYNCHLVQVCLINYVWSP